MTPDVNSVNIITKGIMFWLKTVEIKNVNNEDNCDEILDQLQQHLGSSKMYSEYNSDLILIFALGFKFWIKTVEDQNIKDINKCDMILKYLDGLLNDDEGINILPSTELAVEVEDNPNVIKFAKNEPPAPGSAFIKPKNEIKTDENDIVQEDEYDQSFLNHDAGFDDTFDNEDNNSTNANINIINILNKIDEGSKITFAENMRMYSKVREFVDKGSTVKCEYCNSSERFSSIYNLSVHVKREHCEMMDALNEKYKVFKCAGPDCGLAYYTKKGLFKHINDVHKYFPSVETPLEPKNNFCEQCNKSFTIRQHWRDHQRMHAEENFDLFRCESCDQSFSHSRSLANHNQKFHKHGSDSYLCPDCGMYFNSSKELRRHKRKNHTKLQNRKPKLKEEPKKIQNCPECDEDMTSRSLSYHLFKVHGKGGTCCELCGKKFASKIGLQKHMAIHLDEKSISCEQCGKMFKDQYRLDGHKFRVHSSDEERKYNCKQCGKGFVNKQNLEGHMNMHLGLKPHKCEHCGAGFQNPSNRLAHIKKVHLKDFVS